MISESANLNIYHFPRSQNKPNFLQNKWLTKVL